jgi:hypothetical protein
VPGSIPMPASGTVPTPAVLPGGMMLPRFRLGLVAASGLIPGVRRIGAGGGVVVEVPLAIKVSFRHRF